MKRFISGKKALGIAVGVLALSFLFASVGVLAFERPDMPERTAAAEFSESEVQSFARVQDQIVQIQREYNQRLQNVESEQQQQELIQEANMEMVDAIQDEGLNVEIYNQILTEAQASPGLMERIEEAREEKLY